MICIEVNDILDELKEDNRRLSAENREISGLLVKYRNCLLDFHNSCVCLQKSSNDSVVQSLEDKYHTIVKQVKKSTDNCDENVSNGEPNNNGWEEIFECKDCNKVFNFRSNLIKHIKAVHLTTDEMNFECHLCPFKTSLNEYLRKHLRRKHQMSAKPIKCDFKNCRKRFKTITAMNSHKNSTHLKPKKKRGRPFKDIIFPDYSTNGELLSMDPYMEGQGSDTGSSFNPMRKSSDFENRGQESSDESVCSSVKFSKRKPLVVKSSKVSPSNKSVSGHESRPRKKIGRPTKEELEKELSSGDLSLRPYNCRYIGCGKSFKGKQNLKIHIKRQHTLEKPFQCEECDACFVTSSELRCHRKVHLKPKEYPCEDCNKVLQSKYNYDKHRRAFHSAEPIFYRCGFCTFETRWENLLKGHIRTVHTQTELTVKCDFEGCNKMFRDKERLVKHKSAVHSKVKRLVCEWPGCDYATNYPATLRDHMAAHIGIAQFKCDVEGCGKSFVREKGLAQHMRFHTKKWICSWPECSQRFAEECYLTAHLNKHLNRRPFKCTFKGCNKDFKIDRHLKHHIRTIHKISPKDLIPG